MVANSDTIGKLKKEFILIKVKGPNVECTNEREVLETYQEMNQSIAKNGGAIQQLDKDIKHILKEKSSKAACKKELDDAISLLNIEMTKIQKEKDENKSNATFVNIGDKPKEVRRCRYYNTGYCKYKLNADLDTLKMFVEKSVVLEKICQDRHSK